MLIDGVEAAVKLMGRLPSRVPGGGFGGVLVYVTVIPSKFILDSGEVVTLKASDVEEVLTRDTVFRLWIPPSMVEKVYNHLIGLGFEHATPSISKGERYGLRKALDDMWELHLKLYDDGFIDGEVEVRREYLEHVTTPRRLNVVYEAYEYYRGVYDGFHVWYAPRRGWIVRVLEHFSVKLRDPDTLTPWRPIVLMAIITVLGVAYALSKLSGGSGEPRC